MNKLADLSAALDSLEIPWANTAFRNGEEPAPPFICLVAGFSETAYADNSEYVRFMGYDVALYARERDYEREKGIEAALRAAGINYGKAVTFIDAEALVETAYSVAVEED
ncbi:hypothetical protein [Eggerthella guodeyinii]|uniref:DUF3168 domain-containing protein n=1 Tax=Eggerthella guodeyinii TaxID=2690837 RepID=A0A6N7RLQ3_9ACTN|nr:hypothetical protein [Eggerthella guodeyinii]MRX82255.1 hypothetical protein [Eggerthella guodeyinii]